jgi:2-polyprenyl-3-methyl-5-hydroxy-6-metoxy-1,4-benzoquinol methylase
MDDPDLSHQEHRHALRALSRVNRVSGTASRIQRRLVEMGGEAAPLRMLDVGCGGGDVAVGVARWAARRGLPLEVTGIDVSSVALQHAREAAARAGVEVDFRPGDALEGLPPGPWDLVTANLFLHHLPESGIRSLLDQVARRGRHLLVQDLVRSRWGYLLAWSGMRLLSRSSVGHLDGPLSVRAGFRREELAELAQQAGLSGATVRRRWPARLVLSWSA